MDLFTNLNERFEIIDQRIAKFLTDYGIIFLRYSIGIVFFWFGLLKPLGISPAEDLVRNTVVWLDPSWFISFLGYWEMAIGIGLIIKKFNRVAIFLLLLQMPGTMLPLLLLPEITFTIFPYGLTLEGQYIIKNLVLISAALVIGGHVRDR